LAPSGLGLGRAGRRRRSRTSRRLGLRLAAGLLAPSATSGGGSRGGRFGTRSGSAATTTTTTATRGSGQAFGHPELVLHELEARLVGHACANVIHTLCRKRIQLICHRTSPGRAVGLGATPGCIGSLLHPFETGGRHPR